MIALPYGRHTITEADIEAVATVLRSDWLTTGPKVAEFERALAEFVGVRHAVVVNSGTAALHCAMAAIGTFPGDEVIVPSISFVATANCVVYCGGTPVFADVEADTALIDPADVERKITSRTKAIMAMDYGGQPADYEALRAIIARTGRRIWLVADPPWRSTSVNLKRAINHRCRVLSIRGIFAFFASLARVHSAFQKFQHQTRLYRYAKFNEPWPSS